MKDEAKNIHHMLDQYKPKPELVAVNINNTTDNTRDVLSEYCDKHKIKLRIKESKFYNYAANRNIALENAYESIREYYGIYPTGPISEEESKAMEKNGDIWYIFMVDADNITLPDSVSNVTDDNIDKMDLGSVNMTKLISQTLPKGSKTYPDTFDMTIISGTKYVVNNLFKAHLNGYNGVTYLCPVHEVATQKCWKQISSDIKGCYIHRGRRGARSRDAHTYQKDALLITRMLDEGRICPDDIPRMTFYGAQSYKDARMYSNSYEMYKKRGEDKTGYYQERFMSYINMASIIEWIHIDGQSPYSKEELELKKHEAYSNAFNLIPYRWDGMVPVFRFYFRKHMHNVAWQIAKPHINANQVPKGLFVDTNYYNNPLVIEEFALAAYYSDDKESFKQLINYALTLPMDKLKPDQKARLLSHKSYF